MTATPSHIFFASERLEELPQLAVGVGDLAVVRPVENSAENGKRRLVGPVRVEEVDPTKNFLSPTPREPLAPRGARSSSAFRSAFIGRSFPPGSREDVRHRRRNPRESPVVAGTGNAAGNPAVANPLLARSRSATVGVFPTRRNIPL
jgi:hypothetical protein